MTRYFWDFFGPHAEGTARHFQHHLDEFLAREGLEGCTTGVEGAEITFSAWCDAADVHEEVIRRALRPRRFVEGSGQACSVSDPCS